MYTVVPPIQDQDVIVKYLDKKNARIDEFIRNKERLIGLLEEGRKRAITQYVT
jgi:type I restriction enzyme S subunit